MDASFFSLCDSNLVTHIQELRIVDGRYEEGEHWETVTYLGSGVSGDVCLAMDLNVIKEHQFFCVKKVSCATVTA